MASLNLPPELPAKATAKLINLDKPATHRYVPRVTPPCFALLIENALTPEECREILEYATADGGWEAAMVNTGYGQQKLAPDVRKCDRMIRDDPDLAAKLFARIAPLLKKEGVDVISPKGKWQGMKSHWLGPVPWRLTRLNERLRFLKYGPGEYFKPHCDGSYCTPDDKERSLLTFHAYLGENGPSNVGGSTRFFGGNWSDDVVADVEPIQGRVLVFQHQWLVHSGEEVEKGLKYTVRSDFMYERAPELEEEEEEFQHHRT